MKNLYFIRHGESIANVENLIGGGTDWKLTKKGKQQAVDAGKDAVDKSLMFDVIISSPLLRAHETAKVIAERLDIDPAEIEITAEIKERFFGELEGRHESAFGVSKEYYLQNLRCIDDFEGVETIQDLHERASTVLTKLKKRPEDTVLLVSHAAFGRSLRKAIEQQAFDLPTENFENAKIVKLI